MTPRRIVISGASRGIGAALARAYAAPGVHLALIGRDRDGLLATATECRARGASADIMAIDIRDREGLGQALLAFDDSSPVDLVIANAGVALPNAGGLGEDLSVRGEIDINLLGTLNTILPLAPAMVRRRHGQIALMSSLAAYAPQQSSPGYSASKAAILVYGLALRDRLRPAGIRVNVICPGYIDTEMGQRYRGWRPLAMSAEACASRIRAGLAANRAVIAFPRRLAILARWAQLVPESVMRLGLRAFRYSVAAKE